MVMPGENVDLNLRMNKQMTLKEGQQLTLRSAGNTIASGKVIIQLQAEFRNKVGEIVNTIATLFNFYFIQVTKVNDNMTEAEYAYMKANKKQKDKMVAAGKIEKAF